MPAEQAANPPSEAKEGLSKYVRRMKTALRRHSTSKTPAPQPKPEEAESSKAPAPLPPTPQAPIIKAAPDATVFTNWGAFQEEKARALFAKYGMKIEPGEWQSGDMTVQRVVRPIRMRVRRTCHRCETMFGPDKVCVNCQHARCKSCPRYPPAKSSENREFRDHRQHTEAALQAIVAQKAAAPVQKTQEPALAEASPTGSQEVQAPVRPIVRRTCHRCSTPFEPDTTECGTCKHLRCTMCPREPPKMTRHPLAYPGEGDVMEPRPRTWKKPRQRVRYRCHQCTTLYRSGETNCPNCGQEKGPNTLRDPPHRERPQPDPEVVRRVEERLAKVRDSSG
ncbi:hypothetical protein BO70DRAFT_361245 [Aspergillus heteromorphus CBS 117.55]|uniref:Uncharacterized protein n=1 Tax=Aspergillus heteromorphus CBS 117.55 TaxID=1448321 RepID=A0A317WEN2_9EURO|nr:uncharacterized protein BO70DRAFT_361245 [Aspergillus heteromorphus CBS 117.55]PWY84853.1 hypothetical protein BO70DRAFT_361245 [Aspergillus heteromorphus CBS 117.55]